ncbi:Eco57I restriction-modification methylase domain-containing protein [Isoptericola sp. NPDC057559]|uniref:Eco57I restriction-modification methylase domain-containing protein n=1 Tax=Isoptericola sp. NPDC057559 TaxID=3346168 RepID=UPI003685F514
MAVAPEGEIEYGEVFTRQWVVDTILDLVGYTADRDLSVKTLVEPSVGSGAFLGPVVDRLAASAMSHGVPFEMLTGSIRGYDLQSVHVETSRALTVERLTAAGANEATARMLAKTWLHVGDFLLDEGDFLDLQGSTGTAVRKSSPADFVVGNPPYIRFDDLERATVTAYRAQYPTMVGRSDIYVGFFERSLAMLKPDGMLGFICADRWMRNAYGAKLRSLIAKRYAVDTVWQMHDVDAFHTEVSAYPAITVLSNRPQGSVTVLDTTASFGEGGAKQAVAFVRSGNHEDEGAGWKGARLDSWFEGEDLWPAGGPERIRLLEHLQERFPALEQTGGTTKISIGVATGADKAYVVLPDADVEPDRLMPLIMADDIRSGVLMRPKKVLINPWDSTGALVNLADYPRMAETLASHEAVQKRFVARRNPDAWHRTIDKVYPGLADRPKLLLQDMKAQITPVFEPGANQVSEGVPGGYYPHHNLYYIVSTGWDLEVLGGLLLSRIAEAFIEAFGVKMRGGTLRFQAQYLRKIRVPDPATIPEDVQDRLREAFRAHDRNGATRAAEEAYGLEEGVADSV